MPPFVAKNINIVVYFICSRHNKITMKGDNYFIICIFV